MYCYLDYITCSTCKSRKWCSHRAGVNEHVFEVTGGRIDVSSIFKEKRGELSPVYDPETGEVTSATKTASKRKDLSCLSKKAIPIPLSLTIDSDFKNNPSSEEYYDSFPLDLREVPSTLRPHSQECPECHSSFNTIIDVKGARYHNLSGRFTVDIMKNVCSNSDCSHEERYDGWHDHIFWKSTKELWAHSLLNEWTNVRHLSSVTLSAYYRLKRTTYFNHGSKKENGKSAFPCVVNFTEAYEAFANLQLFHRSLGCIYCEELGQHPQIVGMDVTSILTKYEKVQDLEPPTDSHKLHPEDDVVKMRSVVNKLSMVYIKDYTLRKKTANFMINQRVRIYALDKNAVRICRQNWNAQQTNRLYTDLKDAGCGLLVDFLKWYLGAKQSIKQIRLKLLIGDVLRALANYVPLYKLSPNPINELAISFSLDMMEDHETKALFARYLAYLSLIYQGFQRERDAAWPPILTEVVRDVAKRSDNIVTTLIQQRKKTNNGKLRVLTESEKVLYSSPNACGVSTRLEPCHARPRYDFVSESDAYKARKNKKTPRIKGETETELVADCRKHFDSCSRMSSGALVAVCLQHNQTFLYSILKTPESPDNYFSTIAMYYPDNTCPSDLISDNPCNLYPHMMYREPEKYMNMQSLSDIFHGFAGHKCGPLYCAKYWKECSARYRGINTSLVESNNNKIQRMNTSALWMNLETLNFYLTQLLEIANRLVIRKNEGKQIL